jgi:hypothetical protein
MLVSSYISIQFHEQRRPTLQGWSFEVCNNKQILNSQKYLGNNTVVILEQVICTGTLIKKMSGDSIFEIHICHYLTKKFYTKAITMLTVCVVLNGLGRKTKLLNMQCTWSWKWRIKQDFPLQFQMCVCLSLTYTCAHAHAQTHGMSKNVYTIHILINNTYSCIHGRT